MQNILDDMMSAFEASKLKKTEEMGMQKNHVIFPLDLL